MGSTTLDPFLKGSPATVNITETTWTEIVKQEDSTPADVSTSSVPTKKDASVASKEFWGLTFTSANITKNTTFFGTGTTTEIERLNNTAYIGDGKGSAVMLLADDAKLSKVVNLDDLCTVFGIDTTQTDNPSFIQTFVKKIRGAAPVEATLLQTPGSVVPLTNALWFVTAEDHYDHTCTLSFNIGAGDSTTGPLANAVSWLSDQLGLVLKTPNFDFTKIKIPITLSKTTAYPIGYKAGSASLSSTYLLAYQFDVNSFTLSIEFSETNVSVLLRPATTAKDVSISSLLAKLSDSAPQDDLPGGDDSLFDSFFSHFYLWNVRLSKSLSATSTKPNWSVSLLAGWKVGSETSATAQPIVFAISYDSETSTFMGQLMLAQYLPGAMEKRLPMYDRRLELPSQIYADLKIDKLPTSLDLWEICQRDGNPPPIPTKITQAQISYQSIGDPKKLKTSFVTLRTEIVSDTNDSTAVAGTDAGAAPLGGLHWDRVKLEVQRSSTKDMTSGTPATNVKTDILLSSNFRLTPTDPDSQFRPAMLDISLAYSSEKSSTQSLSAWTLTGHVENLSVGLIAGFFHEDCSRGAMAILGGLTLSSLDIYCLFSSQNSLASTNSSASSFLISGVLKLGDLELDLSYQYISASAAATGTTAAQEKWKDSSDQPKNVKALTNIPSGKTYAYSFEAYLRFAGDSTIASIAESIAPGSASSIPDFVADIMVSPNDPTKTPIKLRYRGDQNGSALVVYLAIDMFNLTFVQLRTQEDPQTKVAHVKRMLRISVDQIPMMKNIPLVNELPQPFDHLVYLWVQDDAPGPDKGFKRELIEKPTTPNAITINGELGDLQIPLLQRKEKQTPTKDDLELLDGHHFMIITDGKVILDHVFGASNKNPNTPAKTETPPAGQSFRSIAAAPSSSPSEALPPTIGKTTTKAGGLSLTSLSVQFKDGHLHLGIDATLTLGPLSLSVVGFIVSITLNDKDHPVHLNNLASVITDKLVTATIRGLDISLKKDPLTIAGGFEHNIVTANGQTEEYFRGGVCVGLEPWKLLAIGQYSIVTVTKPNKSSYKSVFVYGKLDGPLVELEFATISGVRVGFGYNSGIHNPNVNQLYSFPFISDAGLAQSADDPMAVLKALLEPSTAVPVPFVYAKEDMGWFCMGMTITAFDCLTLTTVALIEIDTDPAHRGVIVTLFADGIFQMEPGAEPNKTLFYIEIIVSVEMNFIEGYIAANAALAPQSHVFVPEAHLSGGASFYSWFGDNPHAGDWVITIGGFHRAFSRPSYYPNPDRLRLRFIIGDNIRIVGEGYIAVTPKCAMAGGLLHMSLDVGPVEAWCDVVLDVFLNFKPFFFVGHISLSVGCSFNIDVWFVHIHITVHLGADLTIWGPDKFGGNAYVDLWFFGFSIDFGEKLISTSRINLVEFYEMVRKAGPDGTPPSTDKVVKNNGENIALLKFSLEAGMFPVAPKAKTDEPYPSTGALQEWHVEGGLLVFRIDVDLALMDATVTQAEKVEASTGPPAKAEVPEENTAVRPATNAVINSYPMHRPFNSSTLNVRIHSLDDTAHPKNVVPGFTAELVTKSVPSALWREYKQQDDPLFNSSPAALQSADDSSLTLCMGLRVKAPPPVLAVSPIVEFDAVACMLSTIKGTAPAITSEAQTVLPRAFDAAESSNSKRWTDFGTVLGTKTTTVQPMLSICADLLGWTARKPSDTNTKKEWELSSDVPKMLANQVGIWYESLPMVVGKA